MIKALQNPHFKKIWERMNWQIRHPEAKSLKEALEMEAQKNGCILYDVDSERCFTVFECNYTDEETISLQCISDTGGSTIITYKKANSKQEILGRPITLEDIILLLPANLTHFIKNVDGSLQIKIFGIDEVGCDFFKGMFDWKLTKPLHEQTPETWEKISKLINQK